MRLKVHILILNYNGKDLIEEFFPSVAEAARQSIHSCRASIIDNASSDGSVEYIKKRFPEAAVFEQKQNRILCSYNDVLSGLDDDIVILLNNDIKAELGFVDPLIEEFLQDKSLFMAASKVLNASGQPDGANTRAVIKWGVFWASAKYPGYLENVDKKLPTFSAGIGAFDREKFLELGGYDELYLPGTLEDSDICFRAWKKGWRCVYVPASAIHHMGQVSFHRRFGRRRTRVINFRNVFLFMWKNMSDWPIILEHLIFLPFRLVYALVGGRFDFLEGFMRALPLLTAAIGRRRLILKVGVSDEKVFSIFR